MSSGSGWEDDFDVLPGVTDDETVPPGEDESNDARLMDERPPHWE